jgi:hypothetical protein
MMLCKKGTEADIQRYDGKWPRKIDGSGVSPFVTKEKLTFPFATMTDLTD